MSREAYKKQWLVYDSQSGMPISNQPMYTLNGAVARYNREVAEAMRLFSETSKKEIERWFEIRNFKTGEKVL